MIQAIRPRLLIGRCCTAVTLLVLVAGGCAVSNGPERLQLAADEYPAAFDAAIEAARREGLTGGLRDRRTGVVQTEPAFAPTLLEPWYTYREPINRVVESTISFERRSARFEFLPALEQNDGQVDDDERTVVTDISQYEGPIELRVFVHVERANTPGRRRSTWTRRVTTRSTIIEHGEAVPRAWSPVGRDVAMERRLLAAVDAQLPGDQSQAQE